MEGQNDRGGILAAVTRVLEVVGAVAGMTGWVALMGGAHEYARFDSAGVPNPVRVASELSRAQLLGQGLQALALPLAIGIALAAIAYLWMPRRQELVERDLGRRDDHAEYRRELRAFRRRQATFLSMLLSLLAAVTAGVAALADAPEFTLVFLATFLAFVAVAIVAHAGTPASGAIAAFITAVGVGGIIVTAIQVVDPETRLDRVVVDRTDQRPTVSGFFLGRGGGDVHVAVLPDEENARAGDAPLSVLTIPKDQVESIVIGAPVELAGGKVKGGRVGDPPLITQVSSPRSTTIVIAPTDGKPPEVPPDSPDSPAPETRPAQIVPARLRVQADRDGSFEVPISSASEPVSLVVKAYVYERGPPDRRRDRVGRWSLHVVPGTSVDLPFRLRRPLVRRLVERGHMTARVWMRARGESGTSVVRSRLIITTRAD